MITKIFEKSKKDLLSLCNLINNHIKFKFSNYKFYLLLLIIVSFCLMIHLRYKNEIIELSLQDNKEAFQNQEKPTTIFSYISPNGLDIKFANKIDSNLLFTESNHYLTTMNKINMEARKIPNRTQCIINYKNAFDQITEKEKELVIKSIRGFLNRLIEQDRKDYAYYLKYWLEESKIAKQHTWLESNMPHTHKKYIILNQSWFNNPYANKTTLIHEMTHVHQRYQMNIFEELYDKWGFKAYNKNISTIKGLEQAVLLSRHNPDGMDLNWIFKLEDKYYWITAKYPNLESVELTNTDYLAYPLHVDNQQNYYYLGKNTIDLKNFKAFQDFFKIGNNHYHPNEIAAQYAEFYLEDCLVKRNNNKLNKRKNPGYQIYLEWANKYLVHKEK